MFYPLSKTYPLLSSSLAICCQLSDPVNVEDNNTLFNCDIKGASIISMTDVVNNSNISHYKINLTKNDYLNDMAAAYQRLNLSIDDINASPIKSKAYHINNRGQIYNNSVILYAPIYIDSISDIPNSLIVNITMLNSELTEVYNCNKTLNIQLGVDNYYKLHNVTNMLYSYIQTYLAQGKFDNSIVNIMHDQGKDYKFILHGIDLNTGIFIDKEIKYRNFINDKTTTDIYEPNNIIAQQFANNKIIIKPVIPLAFMFNISSLLNDDEKFLFRNAHYKIKMIYKHNDVAIREKYNIKQFDKYPIWVGTHYDKVLNTIVNDTKTLDTIDNDSHILFKHKSSTNYILNFVSDPYNALNTNDIFKSLGYRYFNGALPQTREELIDMINNGSDKLNIKDLDNISNILTRLYNINGIYYTVNNGKVMVFDNIISISSLINQYTLYIQSKYNNKIHILNSKYGLTYNDVMSLLDILQQLFEIIDDITSKNMNVKYLLTYITNAYTEFYNIYSKLTAYITIQANNSYFEAKTSKIAESIINNLKDIIDGINEIDKVINVINKEIIITSINDGQTLLSFSQFKDNIDTAIKKIKLNYKDHLLIYDRLNLDSNSGIYKNKVYNDRPELNDIDIQRFYINFIN